MLLLPTRRRLAPNPMLACGHRPLSSVARTVGRCGPGGEAGMPRHRAVLLDHVADEEPEDPREVDDERDPVPRDDCEAHVGHDLAEVVWVSGPREQAGVDQTVATSG